MPAGNTLVGNAPAGGVEPTGTCRPSEYRKLVEHNPKAKQLKASLGLESFFGGAKTAVDLAVDVSFPFVGVFVGSTTSITIRSK